MKPNFDAMSKGDLRAYVLSHRDENEAFYKFVDRLKADNKDAVRHPCPRTPEEVAEMDRAIREYLGNLETKGN